MKITAIYWTLFLACFGVQAQDTLFSKNFNDANYVSSATGSITCSPGAFPRIVKTPNSTLYVDGSPALALNIGDMLGNSIYKVLPPLSGFMYAVSLNSLSSAYDTIKTVFSVRVQGTFEYNSEVTLSNRPHFLVQHSYYNSSSSKSYTKAYQVSAVFPVTLQLQSYSLLQSDTSTPDLRKVTSVSFYSPGITGFFRLSLVPTTNPSQMYIFLSTGIGYKSFNESDLKAGLITDFCSGTDNPSDCQTKAIASFIMSSGEVDYTNDILLDNIAILGIKKQLTTDLELSQKISSDPQEIVAAYTLFGEEIQDFTHYTGLAIGAKKDGTREKVFKP